MKQTAVEFIAQELSKQIDNNLFMEVIFNKLLNQAKEMEKEQIKQIRGMLMQGVLKNMSCASAIVELDKITKSE